MFSYGYCRFVTLALLAATTPAAAITIDGDISDWGLHRTGQASDWDPAAAIESWFIEDQTGGNGVRLDPGYGGQRYDAEALYVDVDGGLVYFLLITGLPKDNVPYAPGALALDFGRDGSYEYGIETLDGNGRVAGGVYSNVLWKYGLWDINGGYDPVHPDPAHPAGIDQGLLVGTGPLTYTTQGVTNLGAHAGDAHYVIEAAIPVTVFDVVHLGRDFRVQWTMGCANDAIVVDVAALRSATRDTAPIPEPGAMPLLALAACAMWGMRRDRRGLSEIP